MTYGDYRHSDTLRRDGAQTLTAQGHASRTSSSALTDDQERFIRNVFERHERKLPQGVRKFWADHRPEMTRTKATNFQDVAVVRQPWEGAGRPGEGPLARSLREVSSAFLRETAQKAEREGAGSKLDQQRAAVILLTRSLDAARTEVVHRHLEHRGRGNQSHPLAAIRRALVFLFGGCTGCFKQRGKRRTGFRPRRKVRTQAQVIAQYCRRIGTKLP